MCDIQSSVIHSSTTGLPPDVAPSSVLWDLASSGDLPWGAMPAYQGHPLWEAAHSPHPQYQQELFGAFGPDFWSGGGGKAGVPAHMVPGSRWGRRQE